MSRAGAAGIAVAVGVGVALALLAGEGPPPPLRPGKTAPAFTLRALGEDRSVSLEDLRGQVVLVNFWATWCKPCEEEMPAMERLYQELKAEGFELLAVAEDDDPAPVEAFRKRLQLSFPILLDPGQGIARTYQTTGFPESFLIDADGQMVARYIGPKDWDAPVYVERIRKLLGSPQPG